MTPVTDNRSRSCDGETAPARKASMSSNRCFVERRPILRVFASRATSTANGDDFARWSSVRLYIPLNAKSLCSQSGEGSVRSMLSSKPSKSGMRAFRLPLLRTSTQNTSPSRIIRRSNRLGSPGGTCSSRSVTSAPNTSANARATRFFRASLPMYRRLTKGA